MLQRVLCLVLGYAFGLFQTGFLYSRKKHFDLRSHGSGNSGTTNTIRTMGWKAGVIVFLGDIFKCIAAVVCVWLLFRNGEQDVTLLQVYAGAGCVLGHDYPFYLKGKGGKGMACTAGMMFSVLLPLLPVEFFVFFIPVILTRYVSLGSILASIGMPLFAFVFYLQGWFYKGGEHLPELIVVLCLIGALNIFRHRTNIVRLLHGEENKFGHKKA